jgi:hypothetical protein
MWSWRRQSSSACLSLLVLLGVPVAAGAQAAAEAETAQSAATAEEVGPPAPEPSAAPAPESERGSALVLPTRTPVGAAADGATLDVLIASVLQELGFAVRDVEGVRQQLDEGAPDLDRARDSYLDMDLDGALAAAAEVRDLHQAHGGDLLVDPQLEEAELFMLKVLIDLGRQDEAARLAAQVLQRQPGLRLDPADHSPTMLALWSATVLGQSGRDPEQPDGDRLARFGAEIGVDWVVVGVLSGATGSESRLLVIVVPTAADEERSRHQVILGPTAGWTGAVREALVERFPPPALPPPVLPPGAPGYGDDGTVDDGTAWYKSWWFWTTVGVVVAGGIAGGLGGYYGTREPENPEVKSNVWAAQD